MKRSATAYRVLHLALAILAASCGNFGGYKPRPPQGSATVIGGPGAKVTALLYQPSPRHAREYRTGLKLVMAVFNDPVFRSRVAKENRWLSGASCSRKVPGGEVVSGVLSSDFGEVHYFDHSVCNANATTEYGSQKTSVDPERIEAISAQDRRAVADSLNTLAHELTHLVPRVPGGDAIQAYVDSDHDECTDGWLVSYHLGDMVECHFLHGAASETADFDNCLLERRPLSRTKECIERVDALRSKPCEG